MTSGRIAVLIDGYFMTKIVTKIKRKNFSPYGASTIHQYCMKHINANDILFRIYFYDTLPLEKKATLPISKSPFDFSTTPLAKQQQLLFEGLRRTDNFALRLGTTAWHGEWVLKPFAQGDLLSGKRTAASLVDKDFVPNIKQKGVDMKIGLDMAHLSLKRIVDKIVVITGDADMIPAFKAARREGLIVTLDTLGHKVNEHLTEHADYLRTYI